MISFHSTLSDPGNPWKYKSCFKPLQSENIVMTAHVISKYVWSPIIWQSGVRKQNCFEFADWIALDFDDGHMTVEQAIENVFCDYVNIIGVTKSHRKAKGDDGRLVDRFRVILKLTDRIDRLSDYRATVSQYISENGADEAAKDGARYFFPCSDIISINDEGETVDTIKGKDQKINYEFWNERRPIKGQSGNYQGWIGRLIRTGEIPKHLEGRNDAVYKATIKMLTANIEPDEIFKVLWDAPYPKDGPNPKDIFTHSEFLTTVKSAMKWFDDNIRRGDGRK